MASMAELSLEVIPQEKMFSGRSGKMVTRIMRFWDVFPNFLVCGGWVKIPSGSSGALRDRVPDGAIMDSARFMMGRMISDGSTVRYGPDDGGPGESGWLVPYPMWERYANTSVLRADGRPFYIKFSTTGFDPAEVEESLRDRTIHGRITVSRPQVPKKDWMHPCGLATCDRVISMGAGE